MKPRLAFSAVAIGLLLTGCGNSGSPSLPYSPDQPEAVPTQTATEPAAVESPEHAEPTTAAAAEPTTPPAVSDADPEPEPTRGLPTINERGNAVKTVDEWAALTAGEEPTVEFWLREIVTDFSCTYRNAMPSENGMYLGLQFEMHVHAALAEASYFDTYSITPYDFQGFTPDGMRVNDVTGNSYMCLEDRDELPRDVGGGQKAIGWVVLDVPEETEWVALIAQGQSNGWEWQIP